ncbi:MAG: general secretion pathway protein GspK [Phycisphaerales bacterium]|nr:MAG: general secretion pathway protein GspK [Phycisphaerales bacterium]
MATKRNKTGLVLVAVLWVVMLLMVIVAAVGRTSRLDTKVTVARMGEVRCSWACRAGIETAMAVLYEDERESDCLLDLWSDNDEDFNNVMLRQCEFSVRVVDELGKLNVNVASRDQLMGLEYMEQDIADAIIDWRDSDDTVSTEGVEGGYYENLDFGYTIRNGPFRTIRELLLVRGVTEELLYGEDTNLNGQLDYNERDGDESPPADDGDDELDEGWIAYLTCYSYDKNTDATGSARVNINDGNERQLRGSLGLSGPQAKWIVDNRPNNGYSSISDLISDNSPKQPQGSGGNQDEAQPIDLQTFNQIADQITVSNEEKIPGRVNINTAPEEVLVALLGADGNAEQLAENIIAYRAGLLYGMESIAEVMSVESVDIDTFKRIASFITTRSSVYTIRCVATADRQGASNATVTTEAVVDRTSSPYEILYWYQGASN